MQNMQNNLTRDSNHVDATQTRASYNRVKFKTYDVQVKNTVGMSPRYKEYTLQMRET